MSIQYCSFDHYLFFGAAHQHHHQLWVSSPLFITSFYNTHSQFYNPALYLCPTMSSPSQFTICGVNTPGKAINMLLFIQKSLLSTVNCNILLTSLYSHGRWRVSIHPILCQHIKMVTWPHAIQWILLGQLSLTAYIKTPLSGCLLHITTSIYPIPCQHINMTLPHRLPLNTPFSGCLLQITISSAHYSIAGISCPGYHEQWIHGSPWLWTLFGHDLHLVTTNMVVSFSLTCTYQIWSISFSVLMHNFSDSFWLISIHIITTDSSNSLCITISSPYPHPAYYSAISLDLCLLQSLENPPCCDVMVASLQDSHGINAPAGFIFIPII